MTSSSAPAVVSTPCGNSWNIDDVAAKLDLRASLPGASVYDACTRSTRALFAQGVAIDTVLPLAFGGSWMVNSPAASPVMKGWLEPRVRLAWCDLAALVREPEVDLTAVEATLDVLWPALGKQEARLEALTKVLALIAPDDVPHMTKDTCAFVLDTAPSRETFAPFLSWWRATTISFDAALGSLAEAHAIGRRAGAVLDRVLWFDVVGHTHFAH